MVEDDAAIIVENCRQKRWNFVTKQFEDLGVVRCPDGQLPDGPVCPKCGGERAGMTDILCGEWVHVDVKWVKE